MASNTQKSNWVTIPEDTLHTPVSSLAATPPKESSVVQHKWFWGVSFVVLVVVAAALLAPREMKLLLQGNLFESQAPESAPAEETANGFGMKPLNLLPAKAPEAPAEEPVGLPEAPATEAAPPVEENQSIVQAETAPVTVEVEPVKTEVEPVAEAAPHPAASETPPPAPTPAVDANTKMIEELKKQLDQMQKDRESDAAKIQELTNQLQAGATNPATGVTSLPSVEVTQQLGTENLLQPRYRLNPYRVTVAPQMLLQQGAPGAYGNQFGSQSLYQGNLAAAQKTPDSGPKEVLFIAFLITFFGVVVWKGVRIMAR